MLTKVAVLGAGVMGSGIACQLANNNVKVLLFDLTDDSGKLVAASAIEKHLKSSQSGLTHPSSADLITPLSLATDLALINDCDLVIEAIVEKIDIKQKLYKDLEPYLKAETIITSNTSTFRLQSLCEGLNENLANKIGICHFFNPPRYMKLLEFIPGNLGDGARSRIEEWMKVIMGKEVVHCYDSPGFIANRLGCYLMESTLSKATGSKLNISEIDAALSSFFGFPSTGIFALYDLIGLDVMNMISASLKKHLPEKDEFLQVSQKYPQIEEMIKSGFTGRKGKGGFYKLEKMPDGKKVKYQLNLQSYEYSVISNTIFAEKNLEEFLNSNRELSIFIKELLEDFFAYVLLYQKTICEDIYSIDKAMKLGFAWKKGPYQMMKEFNMIPVKYSSLFPKELEVEKLEIECRSLATAKNRLYLKPVYSSVASSLWNISGKKLCFEINTKMHILPPQIFNDLIKATQIAEELDLDLIIYSDYKHFSAGADLSFFYEMAKNRDAAGINNYLSLGQKALNSLKYCKKPVISCAPGVSLGGGCELLLHSDYIVADQELSSGLVEISLGLIPSFGGLKEIIVSSYSQEILNKRLRLMINSYKSSSALDFKINMDVENISIHANYSMILDYALNKTFIKKERKLRNFGAKINRDIFEPITPSQDKIVSLLLSKLPDDLSSEEKLLTAEREIFCKLIEDQETHAKIGAVISK